MTEKTFELTVDGYPIISAKLDPREDILLIDKIEQLIVLFHYHNKEKQKED